MTNIPLLDSILTFLYDLFSNTSLYDLLTNTFFYDLFTNLICSIITAYIIFIVLSKKRIMEQLEFAHKYIYRIENHYRYTIDYEIVLDSVEKLQNCLLNINNNINILLMPLRWTDKKFIRTMLYNSYRRCDLAMFTTIGYDGDTEKEARLRKIEKYFYDFRVNDDNISIVRIHIELIKTLIEKRNIHQAIIKCKKYCSINNYDALIEINSFKTKSYNNIIQKDGLYQHEYIQLIKKIKNSGGPDI